MSQVKLSDLDRFRKSLAGTIEFATLLAQAPPKARERIITEVERLDPAFLRSALRKVVYFEEFLHLDEGIVTEILSNVSPKLLAFALYGMEPDFQKKILSHMSYPQMKE